MARLVCALLLLAVATASATERIVGGSPSTVDKHPSIVQVQRSLTGIWRQYCAGTILTSRNILTSAGCFNGPTIMWRLRRIIAGSTIRNHGGQMSGVIRVIKHSSWNEGVNRDGDVAVVHLETPLLYTNVVQQAKILGQGAFIPDNIPATQVGWGATFNEEFPSVFSETLRELSVVTVNNQRCALNYANLPVSLTVTPNMVCAGAIGDSGACLGDRGGPLYVNDITVGIVSWGLGCTNNTYPTVHTAIPSYTNWIVNNVY